MRIQRIQLRNFGCHEQLDMRFGYGLNIIKGPNGSGKSTLQRALLKLFFGKPSRSNENERDRSWTSERLYTLSLAFEAPGRGAGELRKDFESNRCRLVWEDGEELTTFADVDGALKSLMRIPSDKLFTNTLFVAQKELVAPSAEKEITTSLEERVTSGHAGITTQKALDRLAKEIDRIGKGYGPGARTTTRPGLILAVQKEREGIAAKISDLRQQLALSHQYQSQHHTIQEQRAALRSELASKKEFAGQIEKVTALREQATSAADIEDQLDAQLEAIEKAQNSLAASERALSALGPVSQLETKHHQDLHKMVSQVEFLQNQPAPLPLPTPVAHSRKLPIGPLVLLIIGVIGAVIGMVLLALQLATFWMGLLTLTSGLFALLGGAGWWVIQRVSGQNSLADAQQAQQQARAKAQSNLQQVLASIGCTSWQDYLSKQDAVTSEKSRRGQAQARLDALLPKGTSRTEIEDRRRTASRERRDAEEALQSPDLQPAMRVTPLEYQNLLREIKQLEQATTELGQRYHELSGRLSAGVVSPTELSLAEEQEAALSQRIDHNKQLLAIYQRTQEMLQRAREQTIDRVRDDLESSISHHFGYLTLAEYEMVEIDHDLNLSITISEPVDRVITPQELSCGARDQLYFAMRLALVDNLWPETQPPLFLDDPFVTFDPERRQAAMRICTNLAAQRQVFLFTCSDDYDEYGNVLSLQSPDLFTYASLMQNHG